MPGPERAGRYLVFDEIAAGGMATVHVGRLVGPGGFGRIVAIKRLHPHLQREPEFVAMLLDEARIASRIYHQNVVQTLDVIADGPLVLVLEYIHGESVSTLAKRVRHRGERIEPAIAIAITVGLLKGLHAAHETTSEGGENLGIVHRDVSPQNVLVGSDGTPRIIDFGIAKATNRIQTTREGQRKGKLSYMSPEQLGSGLVDRRTDVYAASVVLWELLAGERLFAGDDEAAVVGKVLHGEVRAPSAIAQDLPPALDAIVMRGLDRDITRRFATALEMADALEEAGTSAPASRIAAWVAQEWPEGDARRQRLSEIERGINVSVKPAPGDGPADVTESAVAFSPRVPTPEEREPRRAKTRVWPLVAAGLVVALGIGGWRFFGHTTTAVAPEAPAVAPPSVISPPVAAASASVPAPPEEPRAVAVPTAPVAASTEPPRKPPPKPRSACDPPYTLDQAGNHVWKRECFK